MRLFPELGLLAIGSGFKALSDRLYTIGDAVYAAHGLRLRSRWFPVLRLLHDRGPQTIGDIAAPIGQTHSAVSQMVSRLSRDGWVTTSIGATDGRHKRVDLTAAARSELRAAKPVWKAIREEVEARCAAAGLDVTAILAGLPPLLDDDVVEAIGARVATMREGTISIVPFRTELRSDFYRLNAEWLERYFYLEEIDHQVLSNPEVHILEPGGRIFFAVLGDDVVGTCALVPAGEGAFELSKMAVDPGWQGLGIGRKLIEAAISDFGNMRGTTLFLESNTKLAAAIRLYESSGFEHRTSVAESHYQRANVYMVWTGRAAA